jgi:hypothetical protein
VCSEFGFDVCFQLLASALEYPIETTDDGANL